MNLIEYLIEKDALGNQSKRSAVASKVLRGEIETTVAIYPQSRPIADTSSLIRRAMMPSAKPGYISPLDLPKHKAELVNLAAGMGANFEVLRQIHICETTPEDNETFDKKAHITYLKTVLDKADKGATWKVIQKACIEAAKSDKSGPFVVIDECLALKTDEKAVSDKTFQNWITSAKKKQ